MEENTDAVAKYTGFVRIEREQPSNHVDEAVKESINHDYRALPLFEKRLFEYIRVRHYSLRRNRLLACRWRTHIDRYHVTPRAPFQFPKVEDYHFYMYYTRYSPSQSWSKVQDHHRHRLDIAPTLGVLRQTTTNDMHLRKTLAKRKPKRQTNRIANV